MAISLTNQPNQYGISMARSPILYKWSGCSSGYTYQFDILCTTGTTGTLDVVASIIRDPDLNWCITVDASTLIRNFIKNNFSFTTENVVFFQACLYEYINVYNSGMTWAFSNIGQATLGYNKYTDGVNYVDQTTAVDYVMNYLSINKSYPILNYTGVTSISWRDNDVNTGYRILFTCIDGSAGVESYNFPAHSSAKNEVAKIEFIYPELNYTPA